MGVASTGAHLAVGDPHSAAADGSAIARRWIVAIVAICALAAALRIAAARGELWLDEVWSISLVESEVRSPADVIFRLRHDNNHFLNSWVAYSLGPEAADWKYRAPAIVAGLLSVLLAAWALWRLGPLPATAAAALVGLSYLMVHYSSEARGYAYLCCFMLLTYGALLRAHESGCLRWEMLVSVGCVLGFLAHPLFLTVFLALQVWTWLPDGMPIDRVAARRLAMAAVFRTVVPGLWFAWLYWINFRRMQVGGGDPQPYWKVVTQTLSLALGGPFAGPASYFAASLSVLLTAIALVYVGRQSPRRATFYATAIFLMPAALLIASPRSDIYPRYFLGSVLFVYLLWSELLGAMFKQGRRGQTLFIAALVAFFAANAIHIADLVAHGRSHYREAIELLEHETVGPQLNIAADHGLRHRLMFDRASRLRPLSKSLVFEPRDPNAIDKAEWFFTHSLDSESIAPQAIQINDIHIFDLVESFPFAGLSGWQLNVYRRTGGATDMQRASRSPAASSDD